MACRQKRQATVFAAKKAEVTLICLLYNKNADSQVAVPTMDGAGVMSEHQETVRNVFRKDRVFIMKNYKKISHQKAFDYVLFMISSSYFDKQPVCLNPYMEGKLFLYYKEIPFKIQVSMEEQCIRYMEADLLKLLPLDLWETLRMEAGHICHSGRVQMIPSVRQGVTELRYGTDRYILRLMGRYHGERTKPEFACQLIEKRTHKLAA